MTDLFTNLTCHFSPCRTWRYSWALTWDASVPPKNFIGLNPSTADEQDSDPTIRRCIDHAKRWGAGGLVMTNAAAYRATDPKVMLAYKGNRIGEENTIAYLKSIASNCLGNPIAAWGKHACKIGSQDNECERGISGGMPTLDYLHFDQDRHQELKRFMGKLDCLEVNGDGTPSHPLYLKADLLPRPFNY